MKIVSLYREAIQSIHSRRTFLRNSILLPSALLGPPALALPPHGEPAWRENTRRLNLFNEHTREKLDVVYWKNGDYTDDHVGQLNYFMRDHRENKSTLMDKKLYDFLFRLYTVLDTDERIHVLSGFRTAATNASLIKASSNAAVRSFHIAGRAVDFYIPGISNELIQNEARRLVLGGVGYYKKSGFIHLDTGYPRHWINA